MVRQSNGPIDDTMKWVIDSGATNHFCADRRAFSDYRKASQTVRIGDDSVLQATGQGTVALSVYADGKKEIFYLRNALHVPDIALNLISGVRLTEYGKLTMESRSCCLISHLGQPLLEGIRQHNLYVLRQSPEDRALLTTSQTKKGDPTPISLILHIVDLVIWVRNRF